MGRERHLARRQWRAAGRDGGARLSMMASAVARMQGCEALNVNCHIGALGGVALMGSALRGAPEWALRQRLASPQFAAYAGALCLVYRYDWTGKPVWRRRTGRGATCDTITPPGPARAACRARWRLRRC